MLKKSINSFYIYIVSIIFCATAYSASGYTRYENMDYTFSIMYPSTWKIEESKTDKKYSLKFLSNLGGITVAVKKNPEDYYINGFNRIKNTNYNKDKLNDLANEMYGTVPGVIGASVDISTLSNEKALLSAYYYKLESIGSILGYMRIFKIETIHNNRFYKLEFSTQLFGTPEEAEKAFQKILPIVDAVSKYFVFLPG